MKGFPRIFLVVTLALNALIAVVALLWGREIIPDNDTNRYAFVLVTFFLAGVCLVDLLDIDYGPGMALVAIFLHGVALIVIFAAIYSAFGLRDHGTPVEADFPTALYFSIVTWTTLGYGDFAPHSDIRLMAAFEAGVGMIFFGVFLGVAVHWINRRMTEIAGNGNDPD